LVVGRRGARGERRYSEVDLAALRRMRDAITAGLTCAEAAALVNADLDATPDELATAFLRAADALDSAGVVEVLDRGFWLHGLATTVDDVLLPALREIGSRWVKREWDVAQEHLASTTVQGWLRAHQQRETRLLSAGPVVVLACGPEEQHTLALDAFAALLAQEGLTSLDLGAQTPAASLEATVTRLDPAAVVVSCQMIGGRAATVAALQALTGTVSRLYYAGAAFSTQATRQAVPGTYLGSSLGAAATLLAAQTAP
jgi:methanogenic corrinoid protein MtbC1